MRLIKKSLVLLLAVTFVIMSVLPVAASQATSYTYTLDDDSELVRTQDAYLPDRTITELGLKQPEDMFITDDNIAYIADSGNSRIVVYNLDTGKIVKEFTSENVNNKDFIGFKSPSGVYISDKDELYVADPGQKTVFRFDKDGKYVRRYDRPTAPIFNGKDDKGKTNYEPNKVAVDSGGNIYIVSQGVYDGIIQLADTGEFLGYFATNKAKLSPAQAVLKAILPKEAQKNSTQLNTLPSTFQNVFIDNKGIVYSVSMDAVEDGLKKHSTKGTNMFKNPLVCTERLSDVTVDKNGIIYTSDTDGFICAYTTDGELIFKLGAKVQTDSKSDNKQISSISGLFDSLVTIAVDNKGDIWTADGKLGYLQSFTPTEYATTIYNSLTEYEKGNYDVALKGWSYVLKLNQMSVLAHNGVAKAYYNNEKYHKAMEDFEIAGNREGYSEAYWEVRNKQIQKYLGPFLIVIIILIVLKIVIGIVDKKKRVPAAKKRLSKKLAKTPIIGEIGYSFKCARHPIDRYYDIRVGKHGSPLTAIILYFVFFGVYMLYTVGKGFIYQYQKVEDMDMSSVVVGFFAIIILFIICNYLVTSITDGDGTIKQIFMIPAYGLMPAMIAMLVTTGLSYFLTYNESFILTVIMIVGVGWSIATIFEGLATVHDYDFKGTVVSLIITAVFILIAVVVVLVVIIMWDQLSDFLLTLGKEVFRNVTGG